MKKRDISSYTNVYLQDDYNFENIMVEIRRSQVLKFLRQSKAKNVLEIGCGLHSIVNFYDDFSEFVVVEPSSEFVAKALQDCKNLQLDSISIAPPPPLPEGKKSMCKNVTIINDFVENSLECLSKWQEIRHFDFIILSSLLHEVINPDEFLRSVLGLLKNGAILHINVPNANSFHLLWAYKAGLIKKLGNLSERAKSLQQNTTFTLEKLENMVLSINPKLSIIDSGSYFIKPFNHAKMQECLRLNIIDSKLLNGLEKMIEYMPNLGAEIYVNVIRP